MERVALYVGSFDPVTEGHKYNIERMSREFDKGIVAVTLNKSKKERFTIKERLALLREVVKDCPNIRVEVFMGQFSADAAAFFNAKYLIRGLRGTNDFETEQDIRYINSSINPEVETIFYTPPKDLLQVSSTMVVGMMGLLGWELDEKKIVPECTLNFLKRKQKEWEYAEQAKDCKEIAEIISNGHIGDLLNALDLYGTPDRHYHNLTHIIDCEDNLILVEEKITTPNAFGIALKLHDVIYNTQVEGFDNEGASAKFAEVLLKKIGMDNNLFIERVKELILDTKHDSHPESTDGEYIADIDLASLGYSKRLFEMNNQLIRKEYSHIPNDVFIRGRKKVFAKFLNREHIYYTKEFRERYETRAYLNMAEYCGMTKIE